jgi:ABC-type phosphate/phosphonate transport system substrate-binding protein
VNAADKRLVPVMMKVGFTDTAFLQSNRNDIEAALKVLAESIGRKHGFQVTVKSHAFSDITTFHNSVIAGEINLAVFDSITYIAGRPWGNLIANYITSNENTTGRRYLVLVRRDSGINSLEDLRGRSIVEFQAPNLSLGHLWLLSLLRARNVKTHEEFFRTVEHVARPSSAVLPVFFSKRDACLVDDLGFKLMVELNPQVGAQLKSVEVSVPLVGAVICTSETDWSAPEVHSVLLKSLRELYLEPSGQQMLTLFKIDQLVPYEESKMTSVRELWSNFEQARKE